MIEGQRVVRLVFNALVADTGAGGVNTLLAGRIYRDQIPQAAALPAAAVRLVSSTATNTRGGNRVFQNVLIDVALIGKGADYGQLNAAADRIDTVLQNKTGSQDGAVVVELVQEQVTAYTEDDAGTSYAHLVQSFRSPAYAT